MRKIPESGWHDLINPESEEYSPPALEINDEQHILETVSFELSDIEHLLERPTEDPYTGEKNKFRVNDPETFWERLTYIQTEQLNKIKDPEIRKKLKDRILKIEQRIYKQFIPFIDSQINTFGWQNSPLEKYATTNKPNTEEITLCFKQALSILENLQISKEEQIYFTSELDRLKEKLDRYQNELTLFTFEKIEEELQKEISNLEYTNYNNTPKKPLKTLYDEKSHKENILKFDLLLAKAHSLIEIADRMLKKSIKNNCETRAKSLLEHIKHLKEKSESPKTTDNNTENMSADWAWNLLGVERGESKENIRQAYHKLALKHHPDTSKDKDAPEKMRKINEAFEMIKRIENYK